MNDLLDPGATEHVDQSGHFTARMVADHPVHVVEMSGELDLASRAAAMQACTATGYVDVVVDLSALVFMDSAGYGALVCSTATLDGRGGSMVLMNPTGGPRRLLTLIDELEEGLCAPLRYGTVDPPPTATAPNAT
jgi:anti-anti-sigma factor